MFSRGPLDRSTLSSLGVRLGHLIEIFSLTVQFRPNKLCIFWQSSMFSRGPLSRFHSFITWCPAGTLDRNFLTNRAVSSHQTMHFLAVLDVFQGASFPFRLFHHLVSGWNTRSKSSH